ncbi:SDR family oxidoreductase [Litoreibacter janthinus]|uniref:UDP-glucose 4-epimerase n=1 Tax=Litoreibacter janthinus TaxID=670154 RepID=A0A1I6H8V5_9RHOB|nr:SDR family oxidoreductase [Litoreibacter janthinus]SFR50882.1 UDP-glucose 4-epimerase [Litoreibacter janthinus]
MTRILITGAAGAVGQALMQELAGTGHEVIATDLRRPTLPDGVRFEVLDVTTDAPDHVIGAVKPDTVVHLASIVSPPKNSTREFEYDVDVNGSRAVIGACVTHGVGRIVVTSSGAAYGYHADNAVPLTETDPIRGNEAFPYSHHKRLVEEMLAEARRDHPELQQVILRVGTVLGAGVENQITALFRSPKLLMLRGYESPFVFIWTKDLARILLRAATNGPAGIFNVAGDGALGLPDLAKAMGKPLRQLPAWLIEAALRVAKPLGLARYGPEQVRFLKYRPVLDNTALKQDFGYTPELTSAEVFELWKRAAGL